MTEVNPSELKQAVESQHDGTATLVQAVPVHETHEGKTVWDGVVHVFDLAGHPTATRAYAWSYERDDGKRRFFAVLHVPPITSPRDAVRAAIVAEAKDKCAACNGTGDQLVYDIVSAPVPPPILPCPECNGTGRRQ